MHEVGLVESAIRRATAVMEAAGASSIEGLTFAVAPGGHVTPEAIETLFLALSAGTPAAGARLEFEPLEMEYGCWQCGNKFTAHRQVEACSVCGSGSVSAFPAQDLVLKYVDLPPSVADVPAGHRARTDHLRGELARTARRRASFTAR